MRRMVGLLLVVAVMSGVAVADFFTDGGFFPLIAKTQVSLRSPVDTVLLRDTFVVANANNDTLTFAGATFTTPTSQWAKLTFLSGDNEDSVRYANKFSGDASDDSVWLTEDLSVATSVGDSILVEFYSDLTTVDTTEFRIYKERLAVFEKFTFLARCIDLNVFDSSGIKLVVQNRWGDDGAWTTIWTAYLDTIEEQDTVMNGDTTSAGVWFGDQWQGLAILEDSVGGSAVRSVRGLIQLDWRAIK